MHKENCFLTLTYDTKNLPKYGNLIPNHFIKFIKKLKKHYSIKPKHSKRIYPKIRYFHCGEYGELGNRPHYHAILFGFDFPDKIPFRNENGNQLYVSPTLEEKWGHGFATIGAVTFESAAYVARYILKKVWGREAHNYYSTVDEETGEVIDLQPEYASMSRRPGIAKAWYEKFSGDVFPKDFVVIRGREMVTPKYYEKLLEKADPLLHEFIKLEREVSQQQNRKENTPERLAQRLENLEHNLLRTKRKYEYGT
ncbi:replication associated protein [Microviridae sp.]|nr:replication associated protein [Microviridae sp.]